MEWAVINEGRTGPESILLILGERADAESIAIEVRRKGHMVRVHPYPGAESNLGPGGRRSSPMVRRSPVIF